MRSIAVIEAEFALLARSSDSASGVTERAAGAVMPNMRVARPLTAVALATVSNWRRGEETMELSALIVSSARHRSRGSVSHTEVPLAIAGSVSCNAQSGSPLSLIHNIVSWRSQKHVAHDRAWQAVATRLA